MARATGAVHVQECEKQCKSSGWHSVGFCVEADDHQGSVLSPLLFIIVLEAQSTSSREFLTGCPWSCWMQMA